MIQLLVDEIELVVDDKVDKILLANELEAELVVVAEVASDKKDVDVVDEVEVDWDVVDKLELDDDVVVLEVVLELVLVDVRRVVVDDVDEAKQSFHLLLFHDLH